MRRLCLAVCVLAMFSIAVAQPDENDERWLDVILPYQLHHIPDSTCLDGSPSAYYFHPGNATDTIDLIVYFYGGGFCVTEGEGMNSSHAQVNTCEQRSTDFFGSTHDFPQTFQGMQGLMSNSRFENPEFARAAKVWLMYCDGTLWFNQMSPSIFRSLLASLEVQPTRVILAGSDAGAMYILNEHAHLTKSLRDVYPVASLHVVIEGALWMLSRHFETDNEDEYYRNLEQVAKRIGRSAETLINWDQLKSIDAPVFIVQPQYDWYQITHSYGEDCHKHLHMEGCTPNEIDRINVIRKAYVKRLIKFVKSQPHWGLWSIGCFWREALTWNEAYHDKTHRIPHSEGPTLMEAIASWISSGNSSLHYDVSAWPANRGCSHLRDDSFPKKVDNPFDQAFQKPPTDQDDIIDDL